jgi:hypothetical protein
VRIASEKCCEHRLINKSFCAYDVHCSYVLDSTQLKRSNETRDLGVINDSKLNSNKHVDVIVHKAHKNWVDIDFSKPIRYRYDILTSIANIDTIFKSNAQ